MTFAEMQRMLETLQRRIAMLETRCNNLEAAARGDEVYLGLDTNPQVRDE